MELSIMNVIIVMLVCAMSAFLSHMGMAVFHDGIRPVIPEYIEGRMHRSEMASIAFGLSVGFIASVGIGNALVTNLLNPWLLFLATDIIGIASPKKWLAPILGALWGLLCLTGIGGINAALTGLPVDLIGGMGDVGNYVVTGFALFPIIAINYAVWYENRYYYCSSCFSLSLCRTYIFYNQCRCMDYDGWRYCVSSSLRY